MMTKFKDYIKSIDTDGIYTMDYYTNKDDDSIMPIELLIKLKFIYKHFEEKEQRFHLLHKIDELNEQLIFDELEGCRKDEITEELADILVLLMQYKLFYGIKSKDLKTLFEEKVDRTIDRIHNGYYDKKGDE